MVKTLVEATYSTCRSRSTCRSHIISIVPSLLYDLLKETGCLAKLFTARKVCIEYWTKKITDYNLSISNTYQNLPKAVAKTFFNLPKEILLTLELLASPNIYNKTELL